ncbi:hypothetical protein CORC01_09880, partial [Colletotrichum orchidophilum]
QLLFSPTILTPARQAKESERGQDRRKAGSGLCLSAWGSELRKQRVQIWSNWQGTQPSPSLGLLGCIMILVPIRQAQTTKAYSILGCSFGGFTLVGGGFVVIESTLTGVDHGRGTARQLETRRAGGSIDEEERVPA